jgi:lipopolysaccharide export system protein LptC
MTLQDNVRVWTDNGQEVRLQSAAVNFKAGTVVSKEPVVVNLGNGTINATGLEVTENGKVLRFSGRVTTIFESPSDSSAPNPAPTPASATGVQPTSSRP